MNKIKKTIKELRAEQYEAIELYPYYKHWKKAPYTWLKGRFYMESSAILVWFLLKSQIRPNTVTIIYGFAGITTMVLLAIPTNTTIILALLIAFSKGILDWSDGHFARITGQTSQTGHILDVYGANLNELGFYTGLGFYVAAKTGDFYFYYLIPLLLYMMAANLKRFAGNNLFQEMSSKLVINDVLKNKINKSYKKKPYVGTVEDRLKAFLNQFLDTRSRSIDFVCFIILLELMFQINITWIIFILVLFKHFVIFSGSIYIFWKGGWAENQMKNKILEIDTIFTEINEEKKL